MIGAAAAAAAADLIMDLVTKTVDLIMDLVLQWSIHPGTKTEGFICSLQGLEVCDQMCFQH